MYKHCVFCTAAFAENEVLERFSTSVQVAFDPLMGRLWAICSSCGRWNLAPIDERWEAVEDAERLFQGSSLRVQQENIGIAWMRAGVLLVRVGSAPRSELAAWRYGRELQKRRRQHLIGQTLNAISALALGVWIPSTFTQGRRVIWAHGRTRIRLVQLAGAKFSGGAEGIRLELEPRRGRLNHGTDVLISDAEAVLRRVLPAVNHRGADSKLVEGALDQLERVGSAHEYVQGLGDSNHEAASGWSLSLQRWLGSWCLCRPGEDGPYAYPRVLDEPRALAMEMALHDDLEREALAGQLAQLRRAWREAVEIASIADSL